MKKLATLFSVFLFVSCGKNDSPPKIDALQFPVAVLFENSGTRLCNNRDELTTMHTNYLKLNNAAPILIDSQFKIYLLDNFRSVHGGLWLMANPSGATEVTFELKSQTSGRGRARELFVQQLGKQTWRDDLAAKEKELVTRQTLTEMVGVLNENENR